jgi:DNA primase
MLKQLELNPQLRSVTLCLDYDTAGLEATARLSAILRKRGYVDVSILRPQCKDWNEDLKSLNGFTAVPAEEHPQIEFCGEVFGRIASLCGQLPQSLNAVDKLPGLLERFRRKPTPELAEDIAVLALSAAVREYRQLGQNSTPGELAEQLRCTFILHSNRGVRAENIAMTVNKALASTNAVGIRTEAQKREQAQMWLDAVQSFAGFLVQTQAEEMSAKQANSQPKMQM